MVKSSDAWRQRRREGGTESTPKRATRGRENGSVHQKRSTQRREEERKRRRQTAKNQGQKHYPLRICRPSLAPPPTHMHCELRLKPARKKRMDLARLFRLAEQLGGSADLEEAGCTAFRVLGVDEAYNVMDGTSGKRKMKRETGSSRSTAVPDKDEEKERARDTKRKHRGTKTEERKTRR